MSVISKIACLSLLLVLFTKTLISPLLFLNYELRKDYIIQNYCVNKERPELNCEGKCYLAEQLKKTQQKDEEQATLQFMEKLMSTEYCPTVLENLSKINTAKSLQQTQIPVLQSMFSDFIPSTPFLPPIS